MEDSTPQSQAQSLPCASRETGGLLLGPPWMVNVSVRTGVTRPETREGTAPPGPQLNHTPTAQKLLALWGGCAPQYLRVREHRCRVCRAGVLTGGGKGSEKDGPQH